MRVVTRCCFLRRPLVSVAALSCLTCAAEDRNVPADGSGVAIPTTADDDDDDDDDDDNDDDDNSGEDERWDLGESTDEPKPVTFSYIWIANSPEGTVSKIDTTTLVEHARYQVNPHPSHQASAGPSRTSVNLDGDMVVIDRDGGLTKIWAIPQRCPDSNGTPGLQTSTDANFLGWTGEEPDDECIAWRIDDALPKGRAVAWTAPGADPEGNSLSPEIWAAYPLQDGDAEVLLVDTDGAVLDRIPVPGCNCPVYGPYGGAVDRANNFWFVTRDGSPHGGVGPLYRVDYASHELSSFERPAGTRVYGIAIDRRGHVWLAGDDSSMVRYDPDLDEFEQLPLPGLDPTYVFRGLMQHGNGDIFVAAMSGWDLPATPESGLLRLDGETGEVVDFIGRTDIPGILKPAGVGVDLQGYVWLVDTDASSAFRIDADARTYETFDQLVQPYTYSDMTGYGLGNQHPPS
ncbi:MAG: hypothetical protein B7733_07695 [Myxococcales bacterium FL481]|nr:MAG: hypothetical protein B7733_07695 [Myxococcales bacterium FL481]